MAYIMVLYLTIQLVFISGIDFEMVTMYLKKRCLTIKTQCHDPDKVQSPPSGILFQ